MIDRHNSAEKIVAALNRPLQALSNGTKPLLFFTGEYR